MAEVRVKKFSLGLEIEDAPIKSLALRAAANALRPVVRMLLEDMIKSALTR
jgi:hypothetical protein